MFAQFGMTNLKMMVAMSLPQALADYNPFLKSIKSFYAELFAYFETEYLSLIHI